MNMRINRRWAGSLAALILFCGNGTADAYQSGVRSTPTAATSSRFEVTESVESLEVIAGTARRLKFEYQVPELMVENPAILQASPISPNEVLVTGIAPGVSTITVSDPDRNLQTIQVEVLVDTRKLKLALDKYFPDSEIQVHPLNAGVMLAGHVARADQVANIMQTARDFFPDNVVNNLQVNGNQNIAIKVDVYEVSRTKLRNLAVDWSYLGENFNFVSSVSELITSITDTAVEATGQNLTFGVINDSERFDGFIRALEQSNVAKLLDQPVLVAQNGRPAEFLSGGEIPIQSAAGLGSTQIEFRPFGTKLDMVPIVHGNGELTLEVRAEVSEVAPELATLGVPGFRVRRVNTGVKMRAGHTLALAGDYRESYDAENAGIPRLKHSPFFGPLFREVEATQLETELVFLITPRYISDVEPGQLPQQNLGRLTSIPSNHEFYVDGHLEVPRCNDDCPVNQPFGQRGTQSAVGPIGPNVGGGSGTRQGYPQNGFFGNRGNTRHPAARQAQAPQPGFSWPTPARR